MDKVIGTGHYSLFATQERQQDTGPFGNITEDIPDVDSTRLIPKAVAAVCCTTSSSEGRIFSRSNTYDITRLTELAVHGAKMTVTC